MCLFTNLVLFWCLPNDYKELEIRLRQQSHRIRVVPSLMGGAHYLFPSSDRTVAIQVYDQQTIARIELEQKNRSPFAFQQRMLKSFTNIVDMEALSSNDLAKNKETDLNTTSSSNPQMLQFSSSNKNSARESILPKDDDIFDRLKIFRDSFKYTAVFFVLSSEVLTDQLVRIDSFFNQAQNSLASFSELSQSSEDQYPDNTKVKKEGCARVLMVSNNESLLGSLLSIIQSLKPEKRALKEKFFRKEAERTFYPDSITRLPPSELAVAKHVTSALHGWAKRAEVSVDDVNVLMNILGSLEKIVSVDENILDNIPINSLSKTAFLDFFRSSLSTLEREKQVGSVNNMYLPIDQIPIPNRNESIISSSESTQFGRKIIQGENLEGSSPQITSSQCQRSQYNHRGQYTDQYTEEESISNAYHEFPNGRTLASSAHMTTSLRTDPYIQPGGLFSPGTRVYNTVTKVVHPKDQHRYTVQSNQNKVQNEEVESMNGLQARSVNRNGYYNSY